MMERQKFIDRCPDSGENYHGFDGSKERWELNDLTILMDPVDGRCEYFLNEIIPGLDEYRSYEISAHRAVQTLIDGFPHEFLKTLAIRIFKQIT
tara:strand:+ start:121 stop:402 length:282 start_codon:yes stop_codon:yes gene_type:complete